MYLKEAWRSLYGSKQRTLLALLGIIIGISAVISVISIGKIVTAEATRKFRELGTDLVRIRFERKIHQSEGITHPKLIQKMPNNIDSIHLIAPYITSQYETKHQNDYVDLALLGVTASFAQVSKLTLQQGRFISDLDNRQHHVVVGADIPHDLEWQGDFDSFIGREILINGQDYIVVGILQPTTSMNSIHMDMNKTLFVPIKALLSNNRRTYINQALARMTSQANSQVCRKQIQDYITLRKPELEARVITADQLIERMTEQSNMFNILLTGIGSISLMVGGVGIMNIMLVSVTERRQEIGIRRALGARRRDIRYQFLIESLLLSLVGGVFGIGLGILITYIGATINHWEFFMLAWPIIMGGGVSGIIGVFFGWFPARQASNLDPILALRGD